MGKLEDRLSGYTDSQLKTLKRSLTPRKHASWMNGFKVGVIDSLALMIILEV